MSEQQTPAAPRKLSHEVVMEVEGHTVGRFRNETIVRLLGEGGGTFEIATDEGKFPHSGDGSAPPPLAYFAAALVTCLMVQVKAFARRMRIDIRDVKASNRCHWRADFDGRGPMSRARSAFPSISTSTATRRPRICCA